MLNILDMIGYCTSEKYQHMIKTWLRRKLPILEWLPKYNIQDFFYDFITGLSVGITVVLQGLSYAVLAGLTPQVSYHVTG